MSDKEAQDELLLTPEKISDIWHTFIASESNDGSWHYLLGVLKYLCKAQLAEVFKYRLDKIETKDCPVYLQSQGKKWSPYIKVTKELCIQCPFFNKQCDGHDFKHRLDRPDREKIAKLLAFQTLGDYADLQTIESCWEWVVDNNFIDEYYGKADQILSLFKSQIEEMENPYQDISNLEPDWETCYKAYERLRQAILSKL